DDELAAARRVRDEQQPPQQRPDRLAGPDAARPLVDARVRVGDRADLGGGELLAHGRDHGGCGGRERGHVAVSLSWAAAAWIAAAMSPSMLTASVCPPSASCSASFRDRSIATPTACISFSLSV